MPTNASAEDILGILAASSGCIVSDCASQECVCRIQAQAMLSAFRVGRRAAEKVSVFSVKPYSPGDTATLIGMIEGGAGFSKVGQALNRSYGSIYVKARKLSRKGLLNIPVKDRSDLMTQRQKEALDVIRGFWAGHGYAPSYAIIADRMGLKSKGAVHRIVQALEASGYIVKHPRRARTVRPVEHQI